MGEDPFTKYKTYNRSEELDIAFSPFIAYISDLI